MIDLEKTINKLQAMRDYHRSIGNNITADIADDALTLLKEKDEDYKNILSDYEDLAREYEKLLDKKIPLITNGQEVVRCKNCIHWDEGHTEECGNINSICFHNGWCKPNWFCADGERQEGEAE